MILYIAIATFFMIWLCYDTAKKETVERSYPAPLLKKRIFVLNNYHLALFCLWFFCLLTALRSAKIGNDTQNYINAFQKFNQTGIDKKSGMEIGFQYLCILLGKISQDPQILLIACALICYIGIGVYVIKYSNNIVFSLVLVVCWCLSIFTNYLRQNIAMIIVLFAYQGIKSKKYILPILLIALASTFHTSALIAYCLFLHKLLPYKWYYVVVIAIICAVLSLTGAWTELIRMILEEYEHYFGGRYENSGWLASSVYFIRNAFFYLLVYFVYKNNLKAHSVELANFFLLFVIGSLGFMMNLFDRGSMYFLLIAITELPNAVSQLKKEKSLITILICTALIGYFLAVLIFRPSWNYLYPYRFFWQS